MFTHKGFIDLTYSCDSCVSVTIFFFFLVVKKTKKKYLKKQPKLLLHLSVSLPVWCVCDQSDRWRLIHPGDKAYHWFFVPLLCLI